MAKRAEPKLTYEDYLHFPEGRWELIDGEAYMTASPNYRHQEIVGRLYWRVRSFVEEHGGGRVVLSPFDVVLTDHDVVQPDLVFLSDDALDVLTPANIRGRPTWVIEVLSDPRRDRRLKLDLYAREGIPEYWLVDPDQDHVEVRLLTGHTYLEPDIVRPPGRLSPRALPGLDLDLAWILAQ